MRYFLFNYLAFDGYDVKGDHGSLPIEHNVMPPERMVKFKIREHYPFLRRKPDIKDIYILGWNEFSSEEDYLSFKSLYKPGGFELNDIVVCIESGTHLFDVEGVVIQITNDYVLVEFNHKYYNNVPFYFPGCKTEKNESEIKHIKLKERGQASEHLDK